MISLIIPVYNMKNHLGRMMKSIKSQSEKNFEVILVDDGSTDGSGELCDTFAGEIGRLKVIHQENKGLSAARNAGLRAAGGDYVTFPDPDDYLDDDYLETFNLLSRHCGNRYDLEICNHYITGKHGEKVCGSHSFRTFTPEEALLEIFNKHSFGGYVWNKLFHVDIIRDNDLWFDENAKSMADILFCCKYITRCEEIIRYAGKPTYHYDITTGVFSDRSKLNPRKVSGLLDAYPAILEEVHKYGNKEVCKAAHAALFDLSMDFLYQYHRSDYDDEKVLNALRNNLKNNQECYFESPVYSDTRKFCGRIALINEPAFVKLCQAGWCLRGVC